MLAVLEKQPHFVDCLHWQYHSQSRSVCSAALQALLEQLVVESCFVMQCNLHSHCNNQLDVSSAYEGPTDDHRLHAASRAENRRQGGQAKQDKADPKKVN